MEEVIKMMTPENKSQSQGIRMFADYSLQTGFTAMAAEAVPLLEGFYFRSAADCPDCDGAMVKQGACFTCPACGFSKCA